MAGRIFEEAMRIIEEIRMEMRRGFELHFVPHDNNILGVLDIENHHLAISGGFIMGTSNEITLECEESQLVFEVENEAEPEINTNTESITDMIMEEEEKDLTKEPEVHNLMRDELKGEGNVEDDEEERSGYSPNAMKVRSLLLHALMEPTHPDPLRGWVLNKPAKLLPLDQPPPMENLNQLPPPKPPYPHPCMLVLRGYTCLVTVKIIGLNSSQKLAQRWRIANCWN